MKSPIFKFMLPLVFIALTSCDKPKDASNDYLIIFTDTTSYLAGYKNFDGEIIIPVGKYEMCLTDTFKTYAIILNAQGLFVAIDRAEKELYEVYVYDNGPDYPSDGLFRIIKDGKIGYADALTGEIVIAPQFICAHPFENGLAKVSNDCEVQPEGEHSLWISDHWYNINKKGEKVD